MSKYNNMMLEDNPLGTLDVEGFDDPFIKLNDIAILDVGKKSDRILRSWMTSDSTLNYLVEVERSFGNGKIDLRYIAGQFEGLITYKDKSGTLRYHMKQSLLKSFTLKKYMTIFDPSCIVFKAGSGPKAGYYAHPLIAEEFAAHINVSYKLKIHKVYQEYLKSRNITTHDDIWNFSRDVVKDSQKRLCRTVADNSPSGGYVHYKLATIFDHLNQEIYDMKAREFRSLCPELARKNKNLRDISDTKKLDILNDAQELYTTLYNIDTDEDYRDNVVSGFIRAKLIALDPDAKVKPVIIKKSVAKKIYKAGYSETNGWRRLERDEHGFIILKFKKQ